MSLALSPRPLSNFDQKLAEVAPFEQSDQRLRGLIQAHDHIFAIFDAATFDPFGHLAIKSPALIGEFALYETPYREAFRQDVPHDYRQTIRAFERSDTVVLRDQAADRDARK